MVASSDDGSEAHCLIEAIRLAFPEVAPQIEFKVKLPF